MGRTSAIVIDPPDKDASAVPFGPTAISLFAGAGGYSIGFGQAGWERFSDPVFNSLEFDGIRNQLKP